MYHRLLTTLLFICVPSIAINAQNSTSTATASQVSLLPPATKSADVRGAKWGQKQPAILKIEQVKPAKQLPKVLVYTTNLGEQPCALTYLFTGKNDTLANVAYMIKRKTTKAETLDTMFYPNPYELKEVDKAEGATGGFV